MVNKNKKAPYWAIIAMVAMWLGIILVTVSIFTRSSEKTSVSSDNLTYESTHETHTPEKTIACEIKGNISYKSQEKIYHTPGQLYYSETVINPEYGERLFCSEEEAVDAGWRKSFE